MSETVWSLPKPGAASRPSHCRRLSTVLLRWWCGDPRAPGAVQRPGVGSEGRQVGSHSLLERALCPQLTCP